MTKEEPSMHVWEIINPSDAYTIEAPTFPIAAAATLMLGEGRLGLSPENEDDPSLPLFLFGGHEKFVADYFDGDLTAFLMANEAGIADALDSVLLGGFGRRADYAAAMAAIDDPAKREAFREKWQDKRSSLNDIGHAAWRLAERLRERAGQRAAVQS